MASGRLLADNKVHITTFCENRSDREITCFIFDAGLIFVSFVGRSVGAGNKKPEDQMHLKEKMKADCDINTL